MKPRVIIGAAAAVAVALALTACGSGSETAPEETQPEPAIGGTLRIGDGQDGTSIGYPAGITRSISMRQASPAVETLLRYDASGATVPWLAEEVEQDAAAATVTLKLRDGVLFHDGTELDAEDVAWNLNEARTVGLAAARSIEDVAADDLTVTIQLTEWDSTFVSNLAEQLGMIVSSESAVENGIEWAAENPVGTGPYQFVEWSKEQQTVYERFDEYWGGTPPLDSIVWVPFADAVTRENALSSGELDLIWTSDTQSVLSLESSGHVVTEGQVGAIVRSIVPDSANPDSPWSSADVRKAAQMAINREAIAQAIFDGKAVVPSQFAYPGNAAFDDGLPALETDIEAAIELLADAGYPDGFETKLTFGASSVNDKVYQAVQAQLGEIGITVTLEPVQAQAFAEFSSGGSGWEGLMMGQAAPSPDFSAAINRFYKGDGGRAFASFGTSDQYRSLLANAMSAPSAEEKAATERKLSALIADETMLLLTYGQLEFAIASPKVVNAGALETPYTMQWTPEAVYLQD